MVMASPAPGPAASVSRERSFPWIVGAIAFLIYCLTLNHWASLSNIGAIARVSGWTWQPELRQPLTCALLYPFRLLPAAWLPFALNLFTAICAALVLTLLARSFILLTGAFNWSRDDLPPPVRRAEGQGEGQPAAVDLPRPVRRGEGRGEGQSTVPPPNLSEAPKHPLQPVQRDLPLPVRRGEGWGEGPAHKKLSLWAPI